VDEVQEAETCLECVDSVVHVPRDLLLLEQRAFLESKYQLPPALQPQGDRQAYCLSEGAPDRPHLSVQLGDALAQMSCSLPHT
jgi:hypothetical protein